MTTPVHAKDKNYKLITKFQKVLALKRAEEISLPLSNETLLQASCLSLRSPEYGCYIAGKWVRWKSAADTRR